MVPVGAEPVAGLQSRVTTASSVVCPARVPLDPLFCTHGHPNLPDGPRRHRVVVRLSDAELAELQALAAERGVSVPAVLVQSTLTGGTAAAGAFDQLRDELGLALRLLAQVGNNPQPVRPPGQHRRRRVEASPVAAASSPPSPPPWTAP